MKRIFQTGLFCIVLLIPILPLGAQNNTRLTVNLGFPDLVTVGVRFHLQPSFLEIGGGMIPYEDNMISLYTDYIQNFSKGQVNPDELSWYARFGLNYLADLTYESTDQYLFTKGRIGKSIPWGKKTRFEFEAGVAYRLWYEAQPNEVENRTGSFFTFGGVDRNPLGLAPFYPSGKIGIVIKLID